MPATYEPIATTTLGSASNSITFSSISGSFTDLRLVLNIVSTSSGSIYPLIRLNSDTGTNYSSTVLTGTGTAAESYRRTNEDKINIAYASAGTSTTLPGLYTADFFNYSGGTNKTVLMSAQEDKNGSGSVSRSVGLWRNTSAIDTILIYLSTTATMSIGTTATLYGILKA